MSAIAGRVLLIPRGNYDATRTYEMLDMVTYNGSSYICKQECTGVVPTNTTYWMLNASGSAVAYINDIGDVVITNPTNGQVLMYDSTTQKWVNGTITTTLAGLTDTQIASLSNGQALLYDATSQKWVNGNISSTLAELTDTAISSVANKDILQYNTTSGKWENKSLYKKLTATLTAGQTTLTFTDASITATSLCDLYCDGGLDYESVTSTTGSITYTFEAQASDIVFTLVVMNL